MMGVEAGTRAACCIGVTCGEGPAGGALGSSTTGNGVACKHVQGRLRTRHVASNLNLLPTLMKMLPIHDVHAEANALP